ncbi:transthyretin-like family protein [Pleionea sp. CnH1-48]|uniref:transthyretin-like family protein n=1 Tax=Pleionea sp. CnH1-48 TaxID=2954494 RepID=UPI002096962E|nr:transthyretin-like family protein [Pleionea sp. CnH1-48]MCO7223370.1 transthyretin-like family protein [Pleionea sp. CnH1-48]
MANLFRFSASLAARITKCGCRARFSNVRVQLFRAQKDDCPREPSIAKTYQQLSDKDLAGRKNDLLVSGTADDDGQFAASFDGDKLDYAGECIEVVVSFRQIPGSEKSLDPEEHFLLARYCPQWEQLERYQHHYYDFLVPSNIWCAWLKKHDIWVICGRVTTCEKPQSPVGGVKVKAHDVDWIQNDFLGEATTDANGWFYIYYDGDQFKKTPLSPFINLEWTGGPDVYFQIEAQDANGNTILLLDEPPARGRKPDREDITNCFCVELCVDLEPINPVEIPMWTHVGNYQIPDSTNMHDFRSNGYTQVGNLAFTGVMTMIGQTGKATASRKLRYRFLYERNWTGPALPANPVTKDMIPATQVGQIVASLSPLILEPVYVNNPAATHNHVPDVNGWISVESDSRYTPVGNRLIRLNSTHLAPSQGYSNPSPNPDAGTPAAIDAARQVHEFALAYELQEDTGGGWTTIHESLLEKIVINNASALMWLELDEFLTGANLCQPITHTVTVRYTVDHPHLDWFEVEIEKQGAHMDWPVPRIDDGGSFTFRGGQSTGTPATSDNPVNVAAWDACSYIVFLRSHRRLTNGYGGPGIQTAYRTFCKT